MSDPKQRADLVRWRRLEKVLIRYSPQVGLRPPNFLLRPAMNNGFYAPRTTLVHNGVMRAPNRAVRQSVSLPANVAAQVRSLAKARRLSANRMLVELIVNGIDAEKRKQQEFFDLAERFRAATDPDEVK